MKKFLIAAALILMPIQCAVAAAPAPGAEQVAWNVQGEAARVIKYRKDSDDVWQIAGRSGDCEDIVLWKRQKLIELGFAPEDLQVLVIVRQKGARKARGVLEGHVILKIASLNLVLDNAIRFPADYDFYMKEYQFNLVCEADNFGPKMRVQDRCKKR